MSFPKAVAFLPAFGLVYFLAPAPADPQKPRPEPEVYEVRLTDGSMVKMRLLTEEIEVATRYGNLKVPLADVRRIDVGFRYPDGVEKRIEDAVARLGSGDFKVREAAGRMACATDMIGASSRPGLPDPRMIGASRTCSRSTERASMKREMVSEPPSTRMRRSPSANSRRTIWAGQMLSPERCRTIGRTPAGRAASAAMTQ